VLYVHSDTSKPLRYLIWYIILAGLVLAIDFYRYNPEDAVSAQQIKWQWVWPISYLAITLLLPFLMRGCNAEKTVPERVTS